MLQNHFTTPVHTRLGATLGCVEVARQARSIGFIGRTWNVGRWAAAHPNAPCFEAGACNMSTPSVLSAVLLRIGQYATVVEDFGVHLLQH